MSIRAVLVSAVLVIVCGIAASQQPQPAPPVFVQPGPNIPPVAPPLPKPSVVIPVSPLPSPPTPPPEKTVEDLLNDLERVQALKADLMKKEQELKAAIRKKLDAQGERLKKLGVAPKEADRVGKIIIEGNTKTPDQNILDKVEFRPGQVLHYPALETSRVKLEKAGFHNVVVEVVPNELDSSFKDIRVKVEELKPRTSELVPAPGG